MNTQLLIDTAKARFAHNASRTYLADKYSSKLIVVAQSGIWKADPQLISFLSAWTDETIIIIDLYENIVEVNRRQLLDTLKVLYAQVMSDWNEETQLLAKNR